MDVTRIFLKRQGEPIIGVAVTSQFQSWVFQHLQTVNPKTTWNPESVELVWERAIGVKLKTRLLCVYRCIWRSEMFRALYIISVEFIVYTVISFAHVSFIVLLLRITLGNIFDTASCIAWKGFFFFTYGLWGLSRRTSENGMLAASG